MKITYSEKVKQAGADYALLQRATDYLNQFVGPSAGLESAVWDRVDDERGGTRYTLKLTGFSKEVSDTYYPDELATESHMRFRLLHHWGNLLQAYSDVRMKKLQEYMLQEN